MKTVFALTTRLLIFTVIIAGIYSFRNVYSYQKTVVTKNDSVTKKGIALTGTQEVPAVSTSGSGTLDVSYDKSTKTLRYSATWSGMTDSVTMMHFHGPAAKGANAGVVFPIHEFTPGTSGTATGTVTLDEVKTKEADLLGGKWYYNIHTKTHPAGEIRGQVEF
ncbi:MAG: domain containing protein [Segetibacter sp.]|nr:domain containing protein [Segetibacter sp.]